MSEAEQTTGTDLVPVNLSGYAIARQDGGALPAVLSENVGEGGMTVFDLDRIKIPTGGGRAWEVPTLTGEPDAARAVEGVIVAWRDPRAFWNVSFDESGGGTPPDCASDDGVRGYGLFGVASEAHPSGDCRTCPNAQWGSAAPDAKGEPRKGQACKQMRLLFMLREDDLLPVAMFLPPTSIAPLRKYFLRLANRSMPYYSVVTSLTLGQASSGGGITYSVVEPTMIGRLGPEDVERVKAYSESLHDTLNAVRIEQADVDPREAT